jgi:hypothetical protein
VVFASKPSEDGLMVWASKPSVPGLTGLGLRTGEWQIGGHMVASRSLRRGEAILIKHWIRWIDAEKLGQIYP